MKERICSGNKRNVAIGVLLCAALALGLAMQGILSADASGEPKSPEVTIQNENSNSPITKVEIREGGASGELLTTLTDQNPDELLLERSKEYTLVVSVHKTSVVDAEGYVRLRFGNEDSDGNVTYNGLVFKNPPGSLYTTGTFDSDSYLDKVEVRQDAPNPTYGTNKTQYIMQDGEFIYHEKSSLEAKNEVVFYMQFSVDDIGYDGSGLLENGLQLQTGTMDGDTFKADSTLTASLPVELNPELKGSFNGTSKTATLGGKGQILTYSTQEMNNSSEYLGLIYQTNEFDIVYPKGARVGDYGFDTSYNKSNSSRGVITAQDPCDNNDGTMTQHFIVSCGLKARTSDPAYYYYLEFPEDNFKDGDKVTTTLKNMTYTIASGDGNTSQVIEVKAPNPVVTYTITDPQKDSTTLSAVNRTTYDGVYNAYGVLNASYEDESSVAPDEVLTSFGGCRITNAISSVTPYEKTYEAQFNTTNTAAAITYVTVPVGDAENPRVWLTGKNATTGIIETKEADNPLNNRLNTRVGMAFRAGDFGFSSFTAVKAEIGRLLGSTDTCGWSSNFDLGSNLSSAYGYFTTDEPGIVVKNTYRLYNTEPEFQQNQNGDLSVTAQTVSSTDARVGYTGGFSGVFNKDGKKTTDFLPGSAVTLKGYVYPYQVPYAEGYVKGGDIPANIYGNSSFIAAPVLFVTLPAGMTLDTTSLTFKLYKYSYSTNKDIGFALDSSDYTVENISYMNKGDEKMNLYKISFPKLALGYMVEDEDTSVAGDQNAMLRNRLEYNITLNTSKSLATKTYKIADLVGISSENPVTAMPYRNNTTLCSIVNDKYGINGGRDYASVILENVSETTGFGVQQQVEVSINNAVTVNNEGSGTAGEWLSYDPTDPNSILMMGRVTSGQYKLQVANTGKEPSTDISIVVPLPEAGKSLGAAFMYGDDDSLPDEDRKKFDFSMDVTWKDSNLAGFEAQYVQLNDNIELWNRDTELNCTPCEKSKANAILLTKDVAEGETTYDVTLDYSVREDESIPYRQNIFRNIYRYTTGDTTISSLGSYVACEIAEGKLTGTAFYDVNRNGVQDGGEQPEQPLAGIDVVVKDKQGKTYTTKTNEDGYYAFSSIREEEVTAIYSLGTPENEENYRFNVAVDGLDVAQDKKSATASYEKLPSEAVMNIPVSKFWTLTYDGNGATSGIVPAAQEYDPDNSRVTVRMNPDNLYKKYYVFDSWNTEKDGSGTRYVPNAQFTMTDNLTLYAQWKFGTYKATIDYLGGSSSTGITGFSVTYGEKFFSKLPAKETVKREGYVCTGFAGNLTTTGRYNSSASWNMENSTIYARYDELSNFTVNYDSGTGGSSVTERNNVAWTGSVLPTTKDENGSEVAVKPTRTGYTFGGWLYDGKVVDENTTYGDLAKTDDVPSITLTAQWVPNSNYTVCYNVKGALPSDCVVKFDANTTLEKVSWTQAGLLPAVVPTCEGYAFSGWYYEPDEGVTGEGNVGEGVTDAGEIKVSADTTYGDLVGTSKGKDGNELKSITLVAHWTKLESAKLVHYDTQGGTQVDDKVIKDINNETLLAGDTTKPGFEFTGWTYKVSDDELISIYSTTTWSGLVELDPSLSGANDITLTANWEKKTYTIAYDCSGATSSGGISSKTCGWSEGNLAPLDTSSLKKTGYTLMGWSYGATTIDGNTTVSSLIPKDDVKKNDKGEYVITLTPVWAEKTYSVVYDTDGSVVSVPTKVGVSYTSSGLVPATVPTKTGYTFNNWVYSVKSEQGDLPVITASSTIESLIKDNANADSITTITLTADYKVKGGYKIVYDTAGGTKIDEKTGLNWLSKNLYSGLTSNGVPVEEPVKTGYTFKGWSGGRVTEVNENTTYADVAGNDETSSFMTLVAQWSVDSYNIVRRDANGTQAGVDPTGEYVSGTVVPQVHTYGTDTALPTPSKEGYDFAGWYTDWECKNRVTQLDGNMAFNGDITLFAKWIEKINISGLVKIDYKNQVEQQKAHEVNLILQRKIEGGNYEQVGTYQPVTLTEENNVGYAVNSFTFNDVPKTDESGHDYIYRVTANAANYQVSYEPFDSPITWPDGSTDGSTANNVLLSYIPDTFDITMNVATHQNMVQEDVPIALRVRVVFNPVKPVDSTDNDLLFTENETIYTSERLKTDGINPSVDTSTWIYVTEHDNASITLPLTDGAAQATHSVNEVWDIDKHPAYYQFVIDAYELPDGTWIQKGAENDPYTVQYYESCAYYDSTKEAANTDLNVVISRKNVVTFDLEGGRATGENTTAEGALNSQTVLSGESIQDLKSYIGASGDIEKPGYTLDGWYTTDEEGNKTDWNINNNPVAGDMTLHAKWEPVVYTLTLNNGGDNTTSKQVAFGSALPDLSEELPSDPNRVFEGYYTAENGGECWYDSAGHPVKDHATYQTVGDVQLYAHWDDGFNLPISVDANAIPVADRPEKVNVQVTYCANATGDEPSTEDYQGVSDEWPVIAQLGNDAISLDVDLATGIASGSYPVWQRVASADGTKVQAYYQIHVVSYTTEQGEVIAADAPYFVHAYGACGTYKNDGESVGVSATLNRTYCVTFDANNKGNGVPVPQNVVFNSTAEDPTSSLTQDGYHIDAWLTPEGTSWNFATDMVKRDITLTAQWKPNVYTMTFYDSKEDIYDETAESINKGEATYLEVLSDVAVPVKDNYAFAGYYYAGDDGNQEICYFDENGKPSEAVATYTRTADINLYAKWIKQNDITGKLKLNYTYLAGSGDTQKEIVMPNPQRLGSVQVFLQRKLQDDATAQWETVESAEEQTIAFEGFQPSDPKTVPYKIGDFAFYNVPETDINGNAYIYRVTSETVNYEVNYDWDFASESEGAQEGIRVQSDMDTINTINSTGETTGVDEPNYDIELNYKAETFDLSMTVDAGAIPSNAPVSVDLKVAFIWYNPDVQFAYQNGAFNGVVDGNPSASNGNIANPHKWRYPGDFFVNWGADGFDTGVINREFVDGKATLTYPVTSRGLRNGDTTLTADDDPNASVPYYYQFVIAAYHMADGTVIKAGDDDPFLTTWNEHYAVFNTNDASTQALTITLDRTYTATFDLQGKGQTSDGAQATIASQSVKNGSAIKAPSMDAITDPGYAFAGWYVCGEDGNQTDWDFNTPLTSDVTLYAKWTKKTFAINYDLQNVTADTRPATIDYGDQVVVSGLSAAPQYTLPETVTVTTGGKACVNGEYTYDCEAGTLTIDGSKLTGNVNVKIAGTRAAFRPTVSDPADATYTVGDPTAYLSVNVDGATDGGELGYQWYVIKDDPNGAAEPLAGAQFSSYKPLSTTAGVFWYYCVVTNTVAYDDGTQETVEVQSDAAKVTVNEKPSAESNVPKLTPLASATYVVNTPATDVVALDIGATASSGTLEYQWYVKANDTTDWQVIDGAINAVLTPDVSAVGTFNYYCLVTNKLPNGSVVTASNIDHPAVITIVKEAGETPGTDAPTPTITDPDGGVYTLDESGNPASISLLVGAKLPEGSVGELTYQWFASEDGTNNGGKPIQGANDSQLSLSLGTVGTYYYYCEVASKIPQSEGVINTVVVASNAAQVVIQATPAAALQVPLPTIMKQPADAQYFVGEQTEDLLVDVKVPEGTLSYQWYQSKDGTNVDGDLLPGKKGPSLALSSAQAGTFEYYCVVTNTNAQTNEQVSTTSSVATITVEEPERFTVTFDQNDGSGLVTAFTQTNLLKDGKIANPGTIKREGFEMTGWFKDANCQEAWNFDTDTVAGNTVLYAGWKVCTHDFGDWHVISAATSTKEGLEERQCQICGKTETRSIAKLDISSKDASAGVEGEGLGGDVGANGDTAQTGDTVGSVCLIALLLAALGSAVAFAVGWQRKRTKR